MKNEKGFTLVELMVAMAIALIILPIGYTIIFSGTKAHMDGIEEYQLQSDMRVAAEHLNNVTRYSTVVFAITEADFNPNHGVPLTSGWNYIGTCPDDGIVQYMYDSATNSHVKTILIENRPDISFMAEFSDINPDIDDKLIKFVLEGNLSGSANKIAIETELQALNSLQVVDRGHEFNRSIALAYRSDPRPVAENSHAAVAMVLDVSGSMNNNLTGGSASFPNRRIDMLKNVGMNFIDQLELSSVSLVPFSTTANNPYSFRTVDSESQSLKNDINSLTADGGTNTGDGLRRAYYQLDSFNNNLPTEIASADILNYIIVLVDGVTTFGTFDVYSQEGARYYFNPKTDNGNINTSYLFYFVSGYPIWEYGQTGSLVDSHRPAGRGNSLCPAGTSYVNTFGSLITSSSLNINTFVIGFSAVPDELDSVDDIATAIGATSSVPGVNYYIATDEETLQEVFDDIGGQILAELWQVSGP